MIYNLSQGNFQVLEDGVEQKIQSITLEPWADIISRDNLGVHGEWSHTPRGKWITADVVGRPDMTMRFYSIGYVPTNIAAGRCHSVEVRVNIPDAMVFAPKRFCFIPHSATDPLLGTDLGKQLEADLSSNKKAKIPLFMKASFVYAKPNLARIDVVVEFPWDHLKFHCAAANDIEATVGILGVIHTDKQTVARRFSDSAFGGIAVGPHFRASSLPDCDDTPARLPSRYETQVELPPGQYELGVALSDGKNYGRASIPLKIDKYDGEQLAISSAILLKRFRFAEAAAKEAKYVNLAPGYVPLFSQDRQITPTANTEFSRKELVPVYFEVYDPLIAQRPTLEVQAHVRLVSAKTGTAKNFAWFNAAEFCRAGTTTFAIAKAFLVNDLRKGKYRLEIQARDSAGHTTGWRAGSFILK